MLFFHITSLCSKQRQRQAAGGNTTIQYNVYYCLPLTAGMRQLETRYPTSYGPADCFEQATSLYFIPDSQKVFWIDNSGAKVIRLYEDHLDNWKKFNEIYVHFKKAKQYKTGRWRCSTFRLFYWENCKKKWSSIFFYYLMRIFMPNYLRHQSGKLNLKASKLNKSEVFILCTFLKKLFFVFTTQIKRELQWLLYKVGGHDIMSIVCLQRLLKR